MNNNMNNNQIVNQNNNINNNQNCNQMNNNYNNNVNNNNQNIFQNQNQKNKPKLYDVQYYTKIKDVSMNQNNNNQNNNILTNPNAEILILREGSIDKSKVDIIKIILKEIFKIHSDIKSITNAISEKLKEIDGEWFTLVCEKTEDSFDFKFSDVPEENVTVFEFDIYNIYCYKLEE